MSFVQSILATETGRVFLVGDENNKCSACNHDVMLGNACYVCEVSKLVYCTRCSKHHDSLCPHRFRRDEHIDFFGILKKKEA
jgi:hypothetical protein